jgi:GTP-binding protein YchF
MKAGLVGYSLVGKTTLFNALTALNRGGAAGGGQANLGAIKVPDPRVEALCAIYKPKKKTCAEMLFVDVPGPRGKGSGLDAEAIKALGDADAFCVVLRAFPGGDGSPPDPLQQLRDFDSELVLADLSLVEKRLDRLRKEHGKTGAEYHELSRLSEHLDGGRPLRTMRWSDAEDKEMAHFQFLSRRPMLVAVNVAEEEASSPPTPELLAEAKQRGAEAISFCAAVESEISQLEPQDQGEFLASLGLSEPARARFIRAAYRLLDLISFFTVGEDEVKAWTIRRADHAPRAGGRIHSDIERGFIRAEVIHYDDFIASGSEAKARHEGKLRLEGKEYVVQDGDIMNFRFSV